MTPTESNGDYEVAVIIATFGGPEWEDEGDWAAGRIQDQTVKPSIERVHLPNGTLSEARNEGLINVLTSSWFEDANWVVFLDADDDLDPGFCEAVVNFKGDADILHTSVRGFKKTWHEKGYSIDFIEPAPVFHQPSKPLIRQNYLVIGSPIRREAFAGVGGFDDWPVLEDWAFWLKATSSGAIVGDCPEAVYLINDAHERNQNPDLDTIAQEIRRVYGDG